MECLDGEGGMCDAKVDSISISSNERNKNCAYGLLSGRSISRGEDTTFVSRIGLHVGPAVSIIDIINNPSLPFSLFGDTLAATLCMGTGLSLLL